MKKHSRTLGLGALLLALSLVLGMFAPAAVKTTEAKNRTYTYNLYLFKGKTSRKIYTANVKKFKNSNSKVAGVNRKSSYFTVKAKKPGKSVITVKEKYSTYKYNVYVENKNAKVSVTKYASTLTNSTGTSHDDLYALFSVKNNSKRFYYSYVKVTYEYGLSDGKVETGSVLVDTLLPGQTGKKVVNLGYSSSYSPKSISYVKVKSTEIDNGAQLVNYTNQTKNVKVTAKKNGSYINLTAKNNSKKKVYTQADVGIFDKNGRLTSVRTVSFSIEKKKTKKESISLYASDTSDSFRILATHSYSIS